MNLDSSLQTARRATAGRSVLGWVALACLILNSAFWGSLMLDLLAPAKLLSPQTIQAGLSIAAAKDRQQLGTLTAFHGASVAPTAPTATF